MGSTAARGVPRGGTVQGRKDKGRRKRKGGGGRIDSDLHISLKEMLCVIF